MWTSWNINNKIKEEKKTKNKVRTIEISRSMWPPEVSEIDRSECLFTSVPHVLFIETNNSKWVF